MQPSEAEAVVVRRCQERKSIGQCPVRRSARTRLSTADGQLLALIGKTLLRYRLPKLSESVSLPSPDVLVSEGLEDPQQIALDDKANLYISDRGESHQVKVFTAAGKPLRTIGAPGAPKAGPYDPNHMNNPNGLAIDSREHLWVAETDFQPKRVSVWTLGRQARQRLLWPERIWRRRKARSARQNAVLLPRHGIQPRLATRDFTTRQRLLPPRAEGPAIAGEKFPDAAAGVADLVRRPSNTSPIATTAIRPTAPASSRSGQDRDGIATPVAAFGPGQRLEPAQNRRIQIAAGPRASIERRLRGRTRRCSSGRI